MSQAPSWITASQAFPSSVTSWNRAWRRARTGSHHCSVTGHGPAQAVIAQAGWPSTDSQAGAAEIRARPLTVTVIPEASVTPAGRGTGYTVAGAGGGSCPGHGRPAGRWGVTASPKGTRSTWSAGRRPPASTGRVTAPGPSSAWTRTAERATWSLTRASPHRPS